MKKVGIIGGTGYTGGELARILCTHPDIEIVSMTSRQNTGKKVSDVHSYLDGYLDIEFSEKISRDIDLAFVATPHGVAMKEVPSLLESGIKCIDLSGDYRLHDVKTYELWYGHEHTDVENLQDAVYGLPELFRDEIKGSDLVANPGCYATATILACAPLVNAGVANDDIFVDAKSGTSGAGMVPTVRTHHSYCGESIIPYSVGTHRHTPEIEMVLNKFTGKSPDVLFVPNLVPIVRGILSSCYFTLKEPMSPEEVTAIYKKQYDGERFVHVTSDASISSVVASNHAQVSVSTIGNKVIAFGAIDNLVKGASGQAVQCMNLMLGLNETAGLNAPGLGV
ncbi:MAG: N-acetyl-gamma-glutamyl-phosphate reductase [Candidatus Methanomethylophilaceae archaeon]|nr:N-acetyl-gamma-glutamyl-phosphate reductase [Candidatus Methanomethylophilaceae archaeon]